jgi:cellulose biosynthesis protein BcsQ
MIVCPEGEREGDSSAWCGPEIERLKRQPIAVTAAILVSEQRGYSMISQSLSVSAFKGGSGKTSVAAAIAGLAAASGWKVLLVDLDAQGNLAREFGYMEQSDGGKALLTSMLTDQPLTVLKDVRPNLDVVPGGRHTRKMTNWLAAEVRDDPKVLHRLEEILSGPASDRDLVILDTPPGEAAIHELISATAHYFLIPTQGDSASTDGIAEVLMRIAAAREGKDPLNAALELLGIVVTFVPSGGKVIDREIRKDLTSLLGDGVRIFTPSIRFAKQAAIDVRERGVGVAEYEALKIKSEKAMPWHEALRRKVPTERFSSAAGGLAGDYQQLVESVLDAFTTRQQELGYV